MQRKCLSKILSRTPIIVIMLSFLIYEVMASYISSDEILVGENQLKSFVCMARDGKLEEINSLLTEDNFPQTTINMGLCGASRKGHLTIVDALIGNGLVDQEGCNLALFKAVKADKTPIVQRLLPQSNMLHGTAANTSGIYIAYKEALAGSNAEMVQILEPLLGHHLILLAHLNQSLNHLKSCLQSMGYWVPSYLKILIAVV